MLPFNGVRILDLTRLIPGGYATLILADLGGEVLKIEDTESGDYARWMEPAVAGYGIYFHALKEYEAKLKDRRWKEYI